MAETSRKKRSPDKWSIFFALLSALLLTLAFPDLDLWYLAFVALVPLLIAVDRVKASKIAAFLVGWLFGTAFFFGTCWWLSYAPIHYAAIPWPIAYFLVLLACLGAGIFPAFFTLILSSLLRKFGLVAFQAAPLVWVFSEFLRYWLTGNNWNAIGYSQALSGYALPKAEIAGVYLASAVVVMGSSVIVYGSLALINDGPKKAFASLSFFSLFVFLFVCLTDFHAMPYQASPQGQKTAELIAIQPNVPMSGVDYIKYDQLRSRQIELAETEIGRLKARSADDSKMVVVLPESPMNFSYADDREFQRYIGDFAKRNKVSVLFNSAEPDHGTTKYFNSAVMVSADGKEIAQYDKMFLLPFGEAVPPPLEGIMPGFVGNFAYGREFDLLPIGDAKAGVMICFESHFGALSREYVKNGADVLIEMTNDGYLGPTPVLRQHLANAVFRAIETKRPVLRVTNVGITAYINERGQVLGQMPSYTEATQVWPVSRSDGEQTLYVKYGDWFAWLCVTVTILLAGLAILDSRKKKKADPANSSKGS